MLPDKETPCQRNNLPIYMTVLDTVAIRLICLVFSHQTMLDVCDLFISNETFCEQIKKDAYNDGDENRCSNNPDDTWTSQVCIPASVRCTTQHCLNSYHCLDKSKANLLKY